MALMTLPWGCQSHLSPSRLVSERAKDGLRGRHGTVTWLGRTVSYLGSPLAEDTLQSSGTRPPDAQRARTLTQQRYFLLIYHALIVSDCANSYSAVIMHVFLVAL